MPYSLKRVFAEDINIGDEVLVGLKTMTVTAADGQNIVVISSDGEYDAINPVVNAVFKEILMVKDGDLVSLTSEKIEAMGYDPGICIARVSEDSCESEELFSLIAVTKEPLVGENRHYSSDDLEVVMRLVPQNERMNFLPKYFGRGSFAVESAIYAYAEKMIAEYTHGCFAFYETILPDKRLAPVLVWETDRSKVTLQWEENYSSNKTDIFSASIAVTMMCINHIIAYEDGKNEKTFAVYDALDLFLHTVKKDGESALNIAAIYATLD